MTTKRKEKVTFLSVVTGKKNLLDDRVGKETL